MASDFQSSIDSLQQSDPGSVAAFLKVQIENMEASGLDSRTYVIARLSALMAMDAPVTSYVWVLNLARAAGVKDEEIRGLVIALTPTIGYPRVLSAGEKMKAALAQL